MHGVWCIQFAGIVGVLREGGVFERDTRRAFVGGDPCTQLKASV